MSKVEIVRDMEQTPPFKDLCVGDWFEWGAVLAIKISTTQIEDRCYNALTIYGQLHAVTGVRKVEVLQCQ